MPENGSIAPEKANVFAEFEARSPSGQMPIATFVAATLIMVVFILEKKFAFDVGPDSAISSESLDAFGAASFNLVVRAGQWWRVFLAPLLHANSEHLIGNSIALALVGFRLERVIGRGWFAGVFLASALGGIIGSLMANAPFVSTVGASGAITGLMAALLVVSFHNRIDSDSAENWRMRKTSLFFGVPALLPLAFGASGNVDYFAHLGGALAGGAVGLGLGFIWSDQWPRHGGGAAKAAFAGLLCAVIATPFVRMQYIVNIPLAAELAPSTLLPVKMDISLQQSTDLIARYPKDPRVYMAQAIGYVKENKFHLAESALRTSLLVIEKRPNSQHMRPVAQMLLAMILAGRGYMSDAKVQASPVCKNGAKALKEPLLKLKLCN